jgi:hypothetical protein
VLRHAEETSERTLGYVIQCFHYLLANNHASCILSYRYQNDTDKQIETLQQPPPHHPVRSIGMFYLSRKMCPNSGLIMQDGI